MPIKHLALAGGGPAGLVTYGALKELHHRGFWSLGDIKSIYGTSAGAFMGLAVSLGLEWNVLDNYFIRRPWDKIAKVTPDMVVSSMRNKGLFGPDIAEAALAPLLEAKGMTRTTTLAELHEITGVEFVAFTTNVNTYRLESVALSHRTFPDLPIVTAIAMTIAVPVVFQPVLHDGGCYIDGGCLANLPVNACLRDQACDVAEVLAIKYLWDGDDGARVTPESSLVEYLSVFIRKVQLTLSNEDAQTRVHHCLESMMVGCSGVERWSDVLADQVFRERLVAQGSGDATKWHDTLEGGCEELP
jgi:predicted acylesterase/phospholipase RssA